ncbi:MAG TPA: hypothetical protein VFY56_10555, partial [Propionibacteriaceae bacterium]|nr:hypothetical protein [Propionibacteriaceae bacterium]
FGGNTLYASCALLASGLAIAGTMTGHTQVGAMVGTGVGAASCLLARWRGWMLPEAVEWGPSTWFARRRSGHSDPLRADGRQRADAEWGSSEHLRAALRRSCSRSTPR